MQLIIPALNEERRLSITLSKLRDYVLSASTRLGHVEVIVVDNASTDATAAVARAADSPLMPVKVLRCATRGKGAAVRAGVAMSEADVVAFMDADGATELPALVDAVDLLAAGADVAVASRAIPGSLTWERHNRVRATGARLYRVCTRAVVPSLVDTQCGFKVFRGDVARTAFLHTVSTGFSFDVEVLARCLAAGAKVVEFPVTWTDVPGSTFVPSRHGASSFAELFAIAMRMRRLSPAPTDATVLTLRPASLELPPMTGQIPLAAES